MRCQPAPSGASETGWRRTRANAASINPFARRLTQEALGEQAVFDAQIVAGLEVGHLATVTGLKVPHGAPGHRRQTLDVGDFVGGGLFVGVAVAIILILFERQEGGPIHPPYLLARA